MGFEQVAYSLFELDTALKYRLPTVTIVYNNNAWGVWPNALRSAREATARLRASSGRRPATSGSRCDRERNSACNCCSM